MRNKVLVEVKLDELKNRINGLDRLYRGSGGTMYEKEQIYLQIQEKIEEIQTLLNTEYQD